MGISAQATAARRSSSRSKPKADAKTKPQVNGAEQTEEPEEVEHIEITAQTAMQMQTLTGDIAEAFMRLVKRSFGDAWEKFSEHRQQNVIDDIKHLSGKVVHEAVRLAKTDGTEPIAMAITGCQIDVEKGLVLKVIMSRDDDTVTAVNHALGKTGYFVPMNVEDFQGERRPIVPDNVGELGIPKVKVEDGVPGHTISMTADDTTDPKMSVVTCECGWSSKLDVDEIEKQGPLIKAHLAEARLGRGPIGADGKPVTADDDGVVKDPPANPVDQTATEKQAAIGQTMPGDIGPMSPPPPPAA